MTDEEKAAAAKAAQDKAIADAVSAAVKAALPAAISAAVGPAVADAVKPLAENQKVLADTMAKLPPATPATPAKKDGEGGGADARKPLSAEDVIKLLDERDTKRQQSAEQTAARSAFIEKNLAKLPAVYQNQLGTDASKWDEQAKAIQASFEKDLTDRGVKIDAVGGANREGGETAAAAKTGSTGIAPFSGLAEGTQKFASGIVLPGDSTAKTTTPATAGAGGAGGAGAAK